MDNKIDVNEEVQMSDTMHGAFELFKQIAKEEGQVIAEYTKDEAGNEVVNIMIIGETGVSLSKIQVDKNKKVTFIETE